VVTDKKEKKLIRRGRLNLMVMLTVSLVIASGLLVLSMHLYRESGAEQLDLSRPGYIRENVTISSREGEREFPATGAINEEVMREFRELFEIRQEAIVGMDAFRAELLSDSVFGLDIDE